MLYRNSQDITNIIIVYKYQLFTENIY